MQKKTVSRQPLVTTVFIVFVLVVAIFAITQKEKRSVALATNPNDSPVFMNYYANIIKKVEENENFRQVLFTGPKSQLVVMSIPPGEQVGEETHKNTEQTLFFISGTGKGALDDTNFPIGPGDVVVVTAGTKHNFWNTGTQPLKLYTVYAPPNHIDGRVHKTRADAQSDTADEAIGEPVIPVE